MEKTEDKVMLATMQRIFVEIAKSVSEEHTRIRKSLAKEWQGVRDWNVVKVPA